jgi:hypothetical protein
MSDILINILFVGIFSFVPVMILILLPYAGLSLRKFSIPSLFIIFYLIFAYIGILSLYFGWDLYYVETGVVDRSIILKMFIYSSTAIILIVFGFIYARHLLGFNINFKTQRVLVRSNERQSMLIFCLFLLCVFITLIYLRQLEAIALFKVLDGDLIGAALARSSMGNAFEGKYWRYEIFFRPLLDYCVMFFFADFLIKRRCVSGLIFAASFFAAVFSSTMAIAKGPFANLLIMLYLTYVIYKGGNYRQAAAKYLMFMTVSILSVFYIAFMGSPDLASALGSLAIRVFTGGIAPAYYYLDLFPRHIDYLWGASLPNPGGLLPFQNFRLTVEVMNFMSPQFLTQGIVGSAPTVFWTEMYANFGPIGIIFSSFIVGLGLFAVSHILSRLPLTPPVIAATVLLAMHYADLAQTGLSSYFFDSTLIAITAVTAISLFLSKGKIFIRSSLQSTKGFSVPVHEKESPHHAGFLPQ